MSGNEMGGEGCERRSKGIAAIVRFRSCFSYVAVESKSQFGGKRLLAAGKDRVS
jgi:hypothetical protein